MDVDMDMGMDMDIHGHGHGHDMACHVHVHVHVHVASKYVSASDTCNSRRRRGTDGGGRPAGRPRAR